MVAADPLFVRLREFRTEDLPQHVRDDFDKLFENIGFPQDILQVFPDAYIWQYTSAGDWHASFEHSLVIRLTPFLAISVWEKRRHDLEITYQNLEVQLLDPQSRTFINVAEWRNDGAHIQPLNSHDDWQLARGRNTPLAFWIQDDWVEALNVWGLRWQLGNAYAHLALREDSLWFDDAR